MIEQSPSKPFDDDPEHPRGDFEPNVEDSFDNTPMNEHYYDGESIYEQSIGDYDVESNGDEHDQVEFFGEAEDNN